MGLGLVVEIGCGQGALGAWLGRRDPAARRVATTADAAAARLAAPHYDEVLVLPPEAGAPFPAGTADLVVLHGTMADPAAAIAAAAPLLGPDGLLLVEVPNAGHWRLAGQPPAGALTFDALVAAVRAAGLIALDLLAPVADEAATRAEAARRDPGLAGPQLEAWLRRAGPEHFVLRAGRRAPQPLHLLAHVLKPVGGVNDVRIDLPLGAAATWPGVAARLGQQPATPDLPADAPRIVVLHRRLLHTPQAAGFINHFRERGWVVVQESHIPQLNR